MSHSHADSAIEGPDSHDSKPHFHIGNAHHHSPSHHSAHHKHHHAHDRHDHDQNDHDQNDEHRGHHVSPGIRSDGDVDAAEHRTPDSDEPVDSQVRLTGHDSDAVYGNLKVIGTRQRSLNGSTITTVKSNAVAIWEYPIVVHHFRWHVAPHRYRLSLPIYLLHSSLLI